MRGFDFRLEKRHDPKPVRIPHPSDYPPRRAPRATARNTTLRRHPGLICAAALACASGAASRAHADSLVIPCTGPSGLLGLLDRPTVGDSSCVVPEGKAVAEAGFTLGRLSGMAGNIDTVPNLELRFGLADNSELVWLPPNYQYIWSGPRDGIAAVSQRGLGPTTLGIKHEIGFNAHWQWTAEALATLPSGDRQFGSHGLGGAVNGIVSYSSSGPLGVSLMLGVTSETDPAAAGGRRFQSVNPDLVVTWQSSARLQYYLEAYGQSHSDYGQGWGSDADGGVQYLVTPRFEIDFEAGVRIQGSLGGFDHYAGAGIGVLF